MGNSLPKAEGYTPKEAAEARKKILAEHNRVRGLHDAPPLLEDSKMTKLAQESANRMAQNEKLETANTPYGEILYSCSGTGVRAENVVEHFYANGRNGTPQLGQMLSKTSHKIGSGVARSARGTLFVCLLYEGSGSPAAQSNITLEYGGKSNGSSPKPAGKENKVDNGDLKGIRAQVLKDHNSLRSKHSAPALKLDDTLNKSTQAYAEQLARNDSMQHSSEARGGKVGENLYCAGGSGVTATACSQCWYDEIKDYNFSSGTFSGRTGHFTALVWKSTTAMGVGVSTARSGTIYVVAQYSPPGNLAGAFKENVLPRK